MPILIDKVGLEEYLNSTKDLHNGQDYHALLKMLDMKVPKTQIAKSFGVQRTTIYDWMRRLI